MKLAAYLHGAPGRLPFIGHFRATAHGNGLSLAVAGSVAQRSDVASAFRAARAIEAAIRSVDIKATADRSALLATTWDAITAVAIADLGPNAGEDLCVLLAGADESGMGITGMGMGGVWAWSTDELTPLVTTSHPLLGGPGMPPRLRGVLTLDEPSAVVVAIAHDHPPPHLSINTIAAGCGVHP